MKTIEEMLLHCPKCNKKTLHQRNKEVTSTSMMVIHLALILFTSGLWLIGLILYKMASKVEVWECSECRETK